MTPKPLHNRLAYAVGLLWLPVLVLATSFSLGFATCAALIHYGVL